MLRCIRVDYTNLQQFLLPMVKSQCRVEFDRDDRFLMAAISRAVGAIESMTNISVYDALWEWKPTDGINRLALPKTPTRRVLVYQNGPERARVAQSARPRRVRAGQGNGTWVEYTNVELAGPFYFGRSYLGQNSPAQVYRLEVGYTSLNCMPPVLVDPILLLVATIYEHRESIQFGSLNELPDMTRRLLTGLWLPSV